MVHDKLHLFLLYSLNNPKSVVINNVAPLDKKAFDHSKKILGSFRWILSELVMEGCGLVIAFAKLRGHPLELTEIFFQNSSTTLKFDFSMSV